MNALRLEPFVGDVAQARSAPLLGIADLERTSFAAGFDALMMHQGKQWVALVALHAATAGTPLSAAATDKLRVAVEAGCAGVVCGASDVERARALGLQTMVPGIRLAATAVQDQVRVDTPDGAIARGADWLVIGRAVTGVDDPEKAAEEFTRLVGGALGRVPT